MRHLIYIVLITLFISTCNSEQEDEDLNTSISTEEILSDLPSQNTFNEKVDDRPGMKGVIIGSTIQESRHRLKRVNPISGLKLDETTELKEEHAVSFSLADSLQKVGEYELGRITGRAYKDTIYTLKTHLSGELDVTGLQKVLLEIYGEPDISVNKSGDFRFQWTGSEVKINYVGSAQENDAYSMLTIQHMEMAEKLFEEPDPYDNEAASDF